MFLLIPTIDLTEPEFSQAIGGDRADTGTVITDAVSLAQLWRVQNARLVNVKLAYPPTSEALGLLGKIASTLDVPVLASVPAIPTVEIANHIFEAGISRLVVDVHLDAELEEIRQILRTLGKSKVSIVLDVADLSSSPALSMLDLIDECGATKVVVAGEDLTAIASRVSKIGERYPALRILVRYDVAKYEDLKTVSSTDSSGLIAGPSLYANSFPCQNFWCWNSLESVNLTNFSTAKLC